LLSLVPGTDVQAQDAELQAIAGLTSAADRLPYFTGLGTAALAVFTSAARTLVAATTTAAQRAALGLVIGTDVQAQNATLQTIANAGEIDDTVHGSRGGGALHALATTLTAGFMSAADKVALAAAATLTGSAPANVTKAAAAVGVATTAARADHKHDVATAAAASLVAGSTNTEGVAVSLARSDHTHAVAIDDASHGARGGGTLHAVATTLLAGFMAAADKLKLDGIAAGATAYTDEQAQDAVGGMLVDTATVDLAYNDATPSLTATVRDGSITLAKQADLATDRLIGRDSAGTGVPEALTVGGGVEFTGAGGIRRSALTGDVTAAAGSGATTLADDAVTLAKMAAGVAGNMISYDAAGDPVAVGTGVAGHVLTSNGAGLPPSMQPSAGGGGTPSWSRNFLTMGG
ncbi:MAG TPA: hypothetical protein VMW48_15360, partial [Vicinamibacterales bacterium]|nr:hypothetical protein [Vicinamibacterales bacterium]